MADLECDSVLEQFSTFSANCSAAPFALDRDLPLRGLLRWNRFQIDDRDAAIGME